ncbi:MarR family transcriptional regulator, multiple antibiotic resistance protein MarR [Cupriavidus sp. YR651]|uniref:MarR family winged helix-turn-helix transcriptional regulator n=1 Tax=Cupriavidus sp. YR651 TaxID=1855315 RepID=UPI000882B530|nr:winged helix DNA-binding protein [Cupriavidus sp. YR651]SDD72608.1 MarR family transcriptional regulator, multiple antibiotic resistance protein MarR [Cupriavidus sp. YR651]
MSTRRLSGSVALLRSGRLKRNLQHGATAILRESALNISQWIILCHLRERETSTLTEMAQATDHDAGSLSRAIFALRQRGLVTAMPARDDRRSMVLAASHAGRVLCDGIEAQLTARLDGQLHAALGQEGLQQLLTLMDKAATALDAN